MEIVDGGLGEGGSKKKKEREGVNLAETERGRTLFS